MNLTCYVKIPKERQIREARVRFEKRGFSKFQKIFSVLSSKKSLVVR